jgi:hypothetical protein
MSGYHGYAEIQHTETETLLIRQTSERGCLVTHVEEQLVLPIRASCWESIRNLADEAGLFRTKRILSGDAFVGRMMVTDNTSFNLSACRGLTCMDYYFPGTMGDDVEPVDSLASFLLFSSPKDVGKCKFLPASDPAPAEDGAPGREW